MPNSRLARYTGRSLLVLAVLVGAFGIYSFANYARFHKRIAAIKAAGNPVSLADISHEVSKQEDDILTYVLEVKESVAEFKERVPEVSYLNWDKLTSDSAIELFETTSQLHPGLFETITRASEASDMSYENLYETLSFDILDWQKVMSVLDWKARVRLAQGKPDEAAEICLECLKIANLIDRPSLLNHLSGQAFRRTACHILSEVISRNAIDTKLLEQINQELELIDPSDSLLTAIQTERAFSIDFLVNHEAFEIDPSVSSEVARVVKSIPGGPVGIYGNSMLDRMDVIIERSQFPLTTQFPARNKQNRLMESLSDGNMIDMFDRFRNSVGETQALARALRILVALKTSDESAEKMTWSQESLVNLGVPESMTVDPFTGKTMIVKQLPEGWQVYSVGPNQVDDGDPNGGEDFGYGPKVVTPKNTSERQMNESS